MKPNFATEAELAKVVTTWLRTDGWSTFHEIECRGGRADIVAVRRGLVWLVETKLRAGLEVLAQATYLLARFGFRDVPALGARDNGDPARQSPPSA